MSENAFLQKYHKNRNAQNQRLFREKNPHYNSYMCYCKRRRQKGLEIEYTYEQWVEDKEQQTKTNCRTCGMSPERCDQNKTLGLKCCSSCDHSRRIK
jgi:hypothetical protein